MKSKRKLALAVIMALIVSMLPMTVFAKESKPEGVPYWAESKSQVTMKFSFVKENESDPNPTADGTYDAILTTTTKDKNSNDTVAAKGIGMYATVDTSFVKIVLKNGKATGKFAVSDQAGTELLGIFVGGSNDDAERDAGILKPKKDKDTNTEKVITVENITVDTPFLYSYKWIKYAATAEEESTNQDLDVEIKRVGNVSADNLGKVWDKANYKVVDVSGDYVFLKIKGKFTNFFQGEYKDAEKAASTTPLTQVAEGSDVFVKVSLEVKDKTAPVKFSLYSGSMARWIGYEAQFTESTTKKITPDDVKLDENGATITAEEDTALILTKETVGACMQEGAPLTIKSKTGTITFDGDAVSSAFAYLDGPVNFEMKDVKESNPIFADSDYAMVLDLSLTDAEGNNLFKEGGKGTAKITVPFTGEVPEGKTVKVFYITASGREEVEATYDRDAKTVTFTVSHFSQYGLEVADVTQAPNTGDNSLLFVFVGLMLMSGVAFAATKKGLIK